MAILNERVYFYKKNVLGDLDDYTLEKATYTNTGIVIQAGGKAYIEISDSKNDGLKVSKYREVGYIIIDPNVSATYNYGNIVTANFKYTYSDEYIGTGKDFQVIPLTLYNTSVDSQGNRTIVRTLNMVNTALTEGVFEVINNSDHSVTLVDAWMYRSKDVLGQVEEEIGEGGGGGGGVPQPLPWVPPSSYIYPNVSYVLSIDTQNTKYVTFESGRVIPNINLGETFDVYDETGNSKVGTVDCYIKDDSTLALRWTFYNSVSRWTYHFYYRSPVQIDIQYTPTSLTDKQPLTIWASVTAPVRLARTFNVDGISRPDNSATIDSYFYYEGLFSYGILNGTQIRIGRTYNRIQIIGLNSLWREGDNSLLICDASDNVVLNLILNAKLK